MSETFSSYNTEHCCSNECHHEKSHNCDGISTSCVSNSLEGTHALHDSYHDIIKNNDGNNIHDVAVHECADHRIPTSSVCERGTSINNVAINSRSVVTLDDLSRQEILMLLDKAQYIDNNRKLVSHTCDGRVLATLFYEPSTRTRLSFETAMLRLGGQVIGFAGAQLSSVSKGETIRDTLHTVSQYVDIVAIRHPREGAALVASQAVDIPVINAGDGGHMHPTQTLADLATLQQRFGKIHHLTVGLCGDLTYGRTVHSLIETLCRFDYVDFVLISPEELRTPQYVLDAINHTRHCTYTEVRDLTAVIADLDVLYMTRVQQERFASQEEYLRLRDTYILDSDKLALAQPHMAVLHPLPRVNEITTDVDNDPRAAYFQQVRNGMLMRMALESTLLGDELTGYRMPNMSNEESLQYDDNVCSQYHRSDHIHESEINM